MYDTNHKYLLRCDHHKIVGCEVDNTTRFCETCADGKKHCLLKTTVFKHKRAICNCKK